MPTIPATTPSELGVEAAGAAEEVVGLEEEVFGPGQKGACENRGRVAGQKERDGLVSISLLYKTSNEAGAREKDDGIKLLSTVRCSRATEEEREESQGKRELTQPTRK